MAVPTSAHGRTTTAAAESLFQSMLDADRRRRDRPRSHPRPHRPQAGRGGTRRAHEEADHAAAELQVAYHELQAFSYAVAHDLRAPLRAIDRFSQALVEDRVERLDESGRASLERIRRNVQRMGGMIDALLQLSRLVRSTFDATEVDLSAIVRETVEAQRESDPSREVTAIVEPDVIALGDHGLLPC